jgi:hypothetical protein
VIKSSIVKPALALVCLCSLSSLTALGCGDDGGAPVRSPSAEITGTLFGHSFEVADVVLAHPMSWKSAAEGSTAVLISDTTGLCDQIVAGKRSAPGRSLLIRLEQRGDDGAIVPIEPGDFSPTDEGAASSRYGDVYADAVDDECGFTKGFTNQVAIDVTSVGDDAASVEGSVTAHYTNGDVISGTFAASSTCDEEAVDRYLNAAPACE